MQTQGVSLVNSEISAQMSVKSKKINGNSFDHFISQRGAGDSGNFQKSSSKDSVRPVDVKSKPSADKIKQTSDYSKKDSSQGKEMDVRDEVQERTVAIVMFVFQVNFQMPLEDVQDLMDQANVAMEDLLNAVEDGIFGSSGMEMIQSLVMKFHGITDKAAVLTDDSLTGEISSIMDQISDALSDQADANLTDLTASNGLDNLEVIVEKQTENSEEGTDSSGQQTDLEGQRRAEHDIHASEKSAGAQFVENLSEVYEQGSAEEVSSTGQTMSRIVEQVVTQVRVRVMASTTSMELQLHPASLGRVNLQVATSMGVSTAILTVETQAAKEALQSQLITLKETFEQQGLKVNEVEVNVSEFGLGEHNREADQKQQSRSENSRGNGSGNGNSNLRLQDDDLEIGPEEELRETSSERRDVNSTVDYTA